MTEPPSDFDPLDAIEEAAIIEEIDGDEDVPRSDGDRDTAPHESEGLEEPVLTADGQVVPVAPDTPAS
ncbi:MULTISPECIES: hypothetical protein [Aestuariimicrobium]|uniref:hypothetical protein n=1 Tax=Aestuariimicrobium TaxID=396388 RepID=UPI0003B30AAF|nr:MULTISPECIES: hypothetical protein [Aestuariimicrobium]CAI9405908.1 hypothetical protein AESSP_01514 [Aestuariimicrobium sp. T2.26MG-19.2B]